MEHKLPTLGFIGTGTLTSALVTGFCARAPETPYPIVLSPRSRDNATRLKEAWPDRITVAESMQEVVDRSDWVMLAVLPKAGEEVSPTFGYRRRIRGSKFCTARPIPRNRSG